MGSSNSTLKLSGHNINSSSEHSTPSYIHLLSDDILIEILSYVSNAPFENDYADPKSTLTHILPFVSKQFRELCRADSLWLVSFQRLIGNNPNYWKYPLSMLLEAGIRAPPWSGFYNQKVDGSDFMLAAKVSTMDTMNKTDFVHLIMDIYNSVQSKIRDDIEKYYRRDADDTEDKNEAKWFYLTFVINYARIFLPVFTMPYHGLIRGGMTLNLTIFENEYNDLITYVMKGRKNISFRRQKIESPRPIFIFATRNESISRGCISRFAEVCHYSKLQGGRVQFGILIKNYVNLLDVIERNDVDLVSHTEAQIKRFH